MFLPANNSLASSLPGGAIDLAAVENLLFGAPEVVVHAFREDIARLAEFLVAIPPGRLDADFVEQGFVWGLSNQQQDRGKHHGQV